MLTAYDSKVLDDNKDSKGRGGKAMTFR